LLGIFPVFNNLPAQKRTVLAQLAMLLKNLLLAGMGARSTAPLAGYRHMAPLTMTKTEI